MNEASTIYYSGQGYIYRCPECQKVDRKPSIEDTNRCRFCENLFKPIRQSKMNEELYGVIQEINQLETGDIYGAGRGGLENNNLVRAGKAVGVDVIGLITKTTLKNILDKPSKKGDYFAPWRIDKDYLIEISKTPEGYEIIEEVVKMLSRKPTVEEFLAESDKSLPREIFREAQMMILMKKNPDLSQKEKIELLKKEGFQANVEKGRVYVFFGSTVAPECDNWVYWD